MNTISAVINLAITGFYCISIFMHMIRPGDNTGYTRMLLFACLGTIPLTFMMVMVGGRDRWPLLLGQAREFAAQGPLGLFMMGGLGIILFLLPVGLLLGVWFGLGLQFGSLFLMYFIPAFMRMFTMSAQESVLSAVLQGVLLFACFFLGMGLTWLLNRTPVGIAVYDDHFQKIWPGYRDAATMFFSVCVFAFVNQALEGRHALMALFGKQ